MKPDQVSGAYAIPPEVEGVLSNWGRWASSREGRMQRRDSRQFRQARTGGSCAPVTMDVDSAWRVEQALCDPAFSPRFRTLLVEHYAHERDRRDTCKLLAIPWAWYEAEFWKAAMSLRQRLQSKDPAAFLKSGS